MEPRKSVLSFLLVFGLLTGCAAKTSPNSAPVAMFLTGPERNNISQSAPLTHEPEVKWKFSTGGFVRSSPVIAGSLLYVGSNDGNFYAIDVESGAKKWDFKTGGQVASSPAVAGGLVYFTSGDGNLYALDAASGEKKWAFPFVEGIGSIGVEKSSTSGDLFNSSPAVVDGLVYFGSGDAKVYALDARTGKQKWVYEIVKYDPKAIDFSITVHASPAVADGILYTGDFMGDFVALDAKSGKLVWKDNINTFVSATPAVVDGVVFYGGRNGFITAADAKTGKKIWTSPNQVEIFSSFAIKGGIIYSGGGPINTWFARDTKTGKELWRQILIGGPISTPLVAGDMLYVGDATDIVPSGKGNLTAIDCKTGAIVWKFAAGSNVISTPWLQNGVIYFGSDDGNVYALK